MLISIAPLKMVHLLNSFEAGAIEGDSLSQSEYRVISDWHRAVRTLSGICPVIIVDLRELTNNLYLEIFHLVESGLHSRVFLISENAQAPGIISTMCHQYGVRMCVVTPKLLELAMGQIGWQVLLRRVDDIYRFIEYKMLDIAKKRSR